MNFKLVANSVIIQYLGKIIGLAVSLVSVGLLTRYLGVSNFGEYTTLLAIAALAVTVSDFGFFWTTIEGYLNRIDKKQSVQEILGIKLVLTLVIIIASLLIVEVSGFSMAVKQAYWILIIFILSSSLNNILVAVYQSEYKVVKPAVYDVLSRLVSLLLFIWGINKSYHLSWFIWAASIAASVNFFLNWISLRNISGWLMPKIRGFSWPNYYRTIFIIGIIQLLGVAYYKTDVLILSWLKGPHDVGIYGLGMRVVDFALIGATLYGASAFPALVRTYQSNPQKFNDLISQSLTILSILALPIGALGWGFARDIVIIVGGSEFVAASSVLLAGRSITTEVILAILLVFTSLFYLGTIFSVAHLAAGQMRSLLLVNVSAFILIVISNLFLVHIYSNLASAVTLAAVQLGVSITLLYQSVRFYQLTLPWGRLFRVAVAIIGALLTVYLLKNLSVIIRLIGVSFVYLILLTVLLPEFKQLIKRAVNK